MVNRDPKGGGCWYFISGLLCQVCGHIYRIERERRWTKKPKTYSQRSDYQTGYCGCEDHTIYG